MSYVIGINGSPRKTKNSATMLDCALKGAASAGAETELINLTDLNFSGCISCFACKLLNGKSFGRCALRDVLTEVLDKILNADAVIISTPIYFGDVPGMVRSLFERIWFPGLTYKNDGSIAYTKRVKVGLIYTMGMPDLSYYQNLVNGHAGKFRHFLGETSVMSTHETLQYDLYVGDYKLDLKRKIHEEVFPGDCQKSFEISFYIHTVIQMYFSIFVMAH